MNTLHQLNPTAAAYLRNKTSQFWVAAFIPGRHYGQDTSNIMERINFDFKALRELPIVELLQTLWHKVRYQRYQQATTHNAQYTPYCLLKFHAYQIEARQHQAQIASPTEGRIAENTPYGTRYHQVNLQTKSCTCYKYQQNDIPCTHALALILRLNYLFPLVFLPQFCSVQTWQNTYSSNFHPIIFGPHVPSPEPQTDSEEELACNASRTHIPRGRPKQERYRRGEARQHAPRAQEHLCSTCSQLGHNSRTCRTLHD